MMNALGGIVVNKTSVPDNFRQVDTFNTEMLSKLWKVYSVNRDIVDKGRRLENVFWRIWGSERTGRALSGRSVSDMFMRIQNDDVVPPRRTRRSSLEIEYRKVHRRQHPSPSESAQLPPPSLEIECPPTPPPSPIPNTLQLKGLCDTYLSKFPPHSDLTTSILHAFPHAPPSPPPPTIARQSPSPVATRKPSPAAAPHNPASLQPSSHASSFISASPSPPAPTTAARPKPRRTISKKPAVVVKKRGLRPAGPRTKSSSSTIIPTTTTTTTATTTPATSPKRKLKTARTTSAESTQPKPRAEPPQPKPAWIVDPDFRTKYIERQENVLRAKAPATTALAEGVATAQMGVKRGEKGKGKGKKGVLDAPAGVAKVKPGFLAKRQKSELTMLFEGARKGESSKSKS